MDTAMTTNQQMARFFALQTMPQGKDCPLTEDEFTDVMTKPWAQWTEETQRKMEPHMGKMLKATDEAEEARKAQQPPQE